MKKSGFTLVELLVVIAIIAILSGVILVVIDPLEMFKKARDAKRLEDISAIRDALMLNAAQNNGAFPICNTDAAECSTWTSWWSQNLTSSYLPNPPRDSLNPTDNPLVTGGCSGQPTYVDGGEDTGFCFGYFYYSDGVNFEINAFLESNPTRMEVDGGDQPGVYSRRVYEVGTRLDLINALAL